MPWIEIDISQLYISSSLFQRCFPYTNTVTRKLYVQFLLLPKVTSALLLFWWFALSDTCCLSLTQRLWPTLVAEHQNRPFYPVLYIFNDVSSQSCQRRCDLSLCGWALVKCILPTLSLILIHILVSIWYFKASGFAAIVNFPLVRWNTFHILPSLTLLTSTLWWLIVIVACQCNCPVWIQAGRIKQVR